MTTSSSRDQRRQPKGTPVGGQYAEDRRPGADVTLSADPWGEHDPVAEQLLAELEPFGDIPAPQPGQKRADGEPTAATFAQTYVEYFRPLIEAGDERPTAPTEAELLDGAGLTGVDLGRHRGTYLVVENGEPLIEVHTRNGAGNREHWDDEKEAGPECDCTGCVMSYAIPALPTYVSDEDDEGDYTYANIYFRPADPEAGRALLQRERDAKAMNLRAIHRNAIAKGTAAPWVILTDADHHDERARRRLVDERSRGIRPAHDTKSVAEHATKVLEAVRAGEEAPRGGTYMSYPREFDSSGYSVALEFAAKYRAAVAENRAKLEPLRAERDRLSTTTPAIVRLVDQEIGRLYDELDRHQGSLQETEARLAGHLAGAEAYFTRATKDAESAQAAQDAFDRKIADLDWKQSWPGDRADCPPMPETAVRG